MMMVEHVETILGTADDGNHMPAEEFRLLLRILLLPAFLLGMNLAHADRDLCGPQFGNRDGMQDRFTDRDHGGLSLTQAEPVLGRPLAVTLQPGPAGRSNSIPATV